MSTIRVPPESRKAYWSIKMEHEKARAAHDAAARELPTARVVAARDAELKKFISATALALRVPGTWEFDEEGVCFSAPETKHGPDRRAGAGGTVESADG